MQLREVAAISGKPGLYRILKPTRAGVIIESMDEKRQRTVAGATSRVSILNDISMYTTDSEGSVPLGEVLMRVFEKQKGKPLAVSAKSDGADLEGLMADILPNWDSERVYLSDIKKLVTWYNILVQHAADLFVKDEPAQEEAKPESKEAPAKAKKADKEVPAAEEAKPAKKASAKKPAAADKKEDSAVAPKAKAEPAAKKAAPKKPKE
jgi:pyruvate/2-oxoglutarate dehydrogenase complex dihydrolipoamide acyltransferase (E2) component